MYWISVDQYLPTIAAMADVSAEVLVTDGTRVEKSRRRMPSRRHPITWTFADKCVTPLTVTHWMHLPDPPPAPPAPGDLHVVVRRHVDDELIYADLRCRRTKQLGDAGALRAALDRALARWFATPIGARLDAGTRRDFNVGDLAEWQDDPVLRCCLEADGVAGLAVACIVLDDYADGWHYDEPLGQDNPNDGVSL